MRGVTRAKHFCVTYRWELWLLVGIPYGSVFAALLVQVLLLLLTRSEWLSWRYSLYGENAVMGLASAALLSALYGRMRRLKWGFLTLVWGYSLALAAIDALLATVVATVALRSASDPVQLVIDMTWWNIGGDWSYSIASLVVLALFARRASRFSLPHAFFLFVVTLGYILPTIRHFADSPLLLLPDFISASADTAFLLVLVWLLGNFDSREAAFRRRVVERLVALQVILIVLGHVVATAYSLYVRQLYWEMILIERGLSCGYLLVNFILPFVVIYLVRVRQPPAESTDDLRVQ